MKKLDHPNTVGFVDHCKSPTAHYLFMEYCSEGDLKNFIQKFNQEKFQTQEKILTLKESDAKYVIREIIQGLDYLSSNLVMHRDLKLENIMVNLKPGLPSDPIEITNFDFKLGDMGLAKTMKSKNQLNETFAGTPISMAPEVVKGS